jgi:hypothetical protein
MNKKELLCIFILIIISMIIYNMIFNKNEYFNIGCLDGYLLLNDTKCGTYQKLQSFKYN